MAQAAGETRVSINALQVLATGALFQGDLATGQALIEQGEQWSDSIGYPWGEAMFRMHRATLARMRGDYATANAIHEQLRPLLGDIGNIWVSAVAAINAAMLASAQQHYSEAADGYQEAVRLFGEMGDQHFINIAQSELAHIARVQGRYPEALARYARTIARWRELGNRGAAARDLECVTFIAVAQAKAQAAARLFGASEAVRASIESQMMPSEREEYERSFATLRSQMLKSDLAAGWAKGRALPPDDAIEAALSFASGAA